MLQKPGRGNCLASALTQPRRRRRLLGCSAIAVILVACQPAPTEVERSEVVATGAVNFYQSQLPLLARSCIASFKNGAAGLGQLADEGYSRFDEPSFDTAYQKGQGTRRGLIVGYDAESETCSIGFAGQAGFALYEAYLSEIKKLGFTQTQTEQGPLYQRGDLKIRARGGGDGPLTVFNLQRQA